HPECVGDWNISGAYPDCSCGFVCAQEPEPEPEANLTKSTVFLYSTLKPLSLGHYELWAETGETLSSIATFGSGASLKIETPLDLSGAERIFVTIEPEDDSDPAPGVEYLSGALAGGKANLTFGTDFSGANGSYVLLNATGPGDNDKTNGVWFMSQTVPREAALKLPALREGWVYEGWALHKGVYLSTGKFTTAYGSDSSSYFSGPGEAPKFPGEDFLANAPFGIPFPANLDDGSTKIFISAEPVLEGTDPTGPEPFAIRILGADIDGNSRAGIAYPLKRESLYNPPYGDVQISISLPGKIACVEYCASQPHEACIGSWNITGDYHPDCVCDFKCRDRPSD
ncbi:MAG: anti-sigma factor, partial [Candidatus Micrarchaeota archaeon]